MTICGRRKEGGHIGMVGVNGSGWERLIGWKVGVDGLGG